MFLKLIPAGASLVALTASCLILLGATAQAQQRVQIGDKEAILHLPPNPRASAVLVPGKGGVIPSDPLLRNQSALNARGIATLTVPHHTQLGLAIEYMRKVKEPVALIGVSAGVSYAAQDVGRGAKPDTLVLISGSLMPPGKLPPAQRLLKTPAVLPPTLVMHHPSDACDATPASAAEPFVAWSQGRATVQWIGGSGGGRDPCGPNSAHGFMGADAQVVDAIVQFIVR